ncbi:MAG: hypothetical protein ACI4C4_11875 [Lachnospiraceae bacterium]
MATDKKRIQAYVTEKTIKKFKLVSAAKNKSMSEYAGILIEKAVEGYEVEHGEIQVVDE